MKSSKQTKTPVDELIIHFAERKRELVNLKVFLRELPRIQHKERKKWKKYEGKLKDVKIDLRAEEGAILFLLHPEA